MARQSSRSSIHRDRLQDEAAHDELAGEALMFLSAEPGRLRRFFDITGLSPATVREAAAAPGFAASLIAYIAADERCLVAFAAAAGRDPAEIARLHERLSTPPADD